MVKGKNKTMYGVFALLVAIILILLLLFFWTGGDLSKLSTLLQAGQGEELIETLDTEDCDDFDIAAEFSARYTFAAMNTAQDTCEDDLNGEWREMYSEVGCWFPPNPSFDCEEIETYDWWDDASEFCVDDLYATWLCSETRAYLGCYCKDSEPDYYPEDGEGEEEICEHTTYPQCGGSCPDYQGTSGACEAVEYIWGNVCECMYDFDGDGDTEPAGDYDLCENSYPACDGSCDAGKHCTMSGSTCICETDTSPEEQACIDFAAGYGLEYWTVGHVNDCLDYGYSYCTSLGENVGSVISSYPDNCCAFECYTDQEGIDFCNDWCINYAGKEYALWSIGVDCYSYATTDCASRGENLDGGTSGHSPMSCCCWTCD